MSRGKLAGLAAAVTLTACGGGSSPATGAPPAPIGDAAGSDMGAADGSRAPDTGMTSADDGRDALADVRIGAATDATSDAFEAGPVKPPIGGILSVGSVPADGGGVLSPSGKRIAIKDDGFEWGTASCSDGGPKKICVTGSMTP
jgi:hypothetical protein